MIERYYLEYVKVCTCFRKILQRIPLSFYIYFPQNGLYYDLVIKNKIPHDRARFYPYVFTDVLNIMSIPCTTQHPGTWSTGYSLSVMPLPALHLLPAVLSQPFLSHMRPEGGAVFSRCYSIKGAGFVYKSVLPFMQCV